MSSCPRLQATSEFATHTCPSASPLLGDGRACGRQGPGSHVIVLRQRLTNRPNHLTHLTTRHVPPLLQMRILIRDPISLIRTHRLLHISIPTIQRSLQLRSHHLKIPLHSLRRTHTIIITIQLITRHHTHSQHNKPEINKHPPQATIPQQKLPRTDTRQKPLSTEISSTLRRRMHRRPILSRRHKRPILPRNRTHNPSQRRIQRRRNLIHTHLELVKRSPRRTIHLTRQRLSSLKQPPHQHPQILRLRLRPLPQHHQRITLHRKLHAKHPFPEKQFFTHEKNLRSPYPHPPHRHPTTTF